MSSNTKNQTLPDVIGELTQLALKQGLLIFGRRSHGGKYGDWLMVTPSLIAAVADIDAIVDGMARVLRSYRDRIGRQANPA